MRHCTRTLLVSLAVAACTACRSSPAPPVPTRVGTYGELRRIFHEQDDSSRVTLAELTPDRWLYAVGALSGLRGEITITAGRIYTAYPVSPDSSRTEVGTKSTEGATLLVYAQVGAWIDVPIAVAIEPDDFDDRVKSLARRAGVSTDEAFPFLIVGPVADLHWHVIDGARLPPGSSSHADHQQAAVLHERDRAHARLIGFYSERHEGVFTHMGSSTHVHCVIDAPRSSGHVDRVTVLPGATLYLPSALASPDVRAGSFECPAQGSNLQPAETLAVADSRKQVHDQAAAPTCGSP